MLNGQNRNGGVRQVSIHQYQRKISHIHGEHFWLATVHWPSCNLMMRLNWSILVYFRTKASKFYCMHQTKHRISIDIIRISVCQWIKRLWYRWHHKWPPHRMVCVAMNQIGVNATMMANVNYVFSERTHKAIVNWNVWPILQYIDAVVRNSLYHVSICISNIAIRNSF